jgi:hypothetical protein
MDRIYALIEQMDLALDQLRADTPTAGRLALILVDNAVELALHTTCETAVRLDYEPGGALPPKYDAKERAAATGQKFDPKVTFCQRLSLLSPAEAGSVRVMHGYRNELYHAGLRYDPIILTLASEYFGLAADIIPRMRVVATLLVPAESDRVRKYFSGDIWDAEPVERIREASKKLRNARPPLTAPVAVPLSDFAVQLVTEVQDDLEFLASDNPHRWNDKRVLFEIQLHHYAFQAKDGPRLTTAALPSGVSVFDRLEDLRRNWTPQHTSSPVARWLARAQAIAASTDAHQALARFQALRRDVTPLADIVHEAARALDAQIQLSIDRRRGR